MQHLHCIYPSGLVSVPSSWAAHNLSHSPCSGAWSISPAGETRHLFTWVSPGRLQVPQVSIMLLSCSVKDSMKLSETVYPKADWHLSSEGQTFFHNHCPMAPQPSPFIAPIAGFCLPCALRHSLTLQPWNCPQPFALCDVHLLPAQPFLGSLGGRWI